MEKAVPSADFQGMAQRMKEQFLAGGLDPEIEHSLIATVPPGDLKSISMCRPG